ncbi:MAG: hypothetical protein WCG85_12510 [Polyangia bacterium]
MAQAAGPLVMEWAFAWRPDGFAEAMDDRIKLVQRAAREAARLAASRGIAGWKSRKDHASLDVHVRRALAPIEYRPGAKKTPAHWSVTSFLSPPLSARERAGLPSFETERAMLLGYWFAVPELGPHDGGNGFTVLAQRLGEAEKTLIDIKRRFTPEAARGAHRPATSEVEARRKLIGTAKALGVGIAKLTRAIAKMDIRFGEPLTPPDDEELSSEDHKAHVWKNRFDVATSKARKKFRKR